MRVRYNNSWQLAPSRVWYNNAWRLAPARTWTGSTWQLAPGAGATFGNAPTPTDTSATYHYYLFTTDFILQVTGEGFVDFAVIGGGGRASISFSGGGGGGGEVVIQNTIRVLPGDELVCTPGFASFQADGNASELRLNRQGVVTLYRAEGGGRGGHYSVISGSGFSNVFSQVLPTDGTNGAGGGGGLGQIMNLRATANSVTGFHSFSATEGAGEGGDGGTISVTGGAGGGGGEGAGGAGSNGIGTTGGAGGAGINVWGFNCGAGGGGRGGGQGSDASNFTAEGLAQVTLMGAAGTGGGHGNTAGTTPNPPLSSTYTYNGQHGGILIRNVRSA